MGEGIQGSEQQPPRPRQRRLANGPQGYLLVAMLIAALMLIGAGVVIGRMTADSDDNQAGECAEARRTSEADMATIDQRKREMDQATSDSSPYYSSVSVDEARAAWLDTTRHLMTIIVQNPKCFSAADRATAQTTLDALKQNADQQALCAAVGKGPWWDPC
ncbi:hypothetical protein [Streptomyces heilongjiangensis]|uniref:Fork-head domain-containing protein n=1 Tax=Streptomyces heilongjiangensis TaxID=945052 RepID=A0ABW1BJE1_9ACTN|nr:hypothetical protein [Streptomyces heilongjiangensis]MDC2952515.1 hypothetical protein [Streptomyces heilongjiangensis]